MEKAIPSFAPQFPGGSGPASNSANSLISWTSSRPPWHDELSQFGRVAQFGRFRIPSIRDWAEALEASLPTGHNGGGSDKSRYTPENW